MGKSEAGVSIVDGVDGPTSVFVATKEGKQKLLLRIKNFYDKKKIERIEKKIVANPHTIDEVIHYITDTYNAVEMPSDEWFYIEERKSIKETLVIRHRPELLGDLLEVECPVEVTKATMKVFFEAMKKRALKAEQIPDEEFPIDFHIYEIKYNFGKIQILLEKCWNEFEVSYDGKRMAIRKLQKIVNDIYLYYGVEQKDIDNRTLRFSALVRMLSYRG